jgi:hypothetical protein
MKIFLQGHILSISGDALTWSRTSQKKNYTPKFDMVGLTDVWLLWGCQGQASLLAVRLSRECTQSTHFGKEEELKVWTIGQALQGYLQSVDWNSDLWYGDVKQVPPTK